MTAKAVPSPEEKFSAGEFETFLDYLDISDADAARLLGVAEATIKRCRKYGITGFGARFVATIYQLKLTALQLSRHHGVALTGLPRSRFQAQRNNHKPISPASLVPTGLHQAMVAAYLQEEGAASTAQLVAYFERKAGKPALVAPTLDAMKEAGLVSCDLKGNWTIKASEPAPRGVWERKQ